jgi:hypothetical protein
LFVWDSLIHKRRMMKFENIIVLLHSWQTVIVNKQWTVLLVSHFPSFSLQCHIIPTLWTLPQLPLGWTKWTEKYYFQIECF